MIYQIPKDNLEKLQTRIEKLNRKANKLGFLPIRFDIIRTQFETGHNGEFYQVVEIDIEGQAPKVEGWEFIATLQSEEHGNVINRLNTEIEIPIRYRETIGVCEHCNTNRFRKNTYLLFNSETNEFKQVGKSCLNDFIGVDVTNYINYCTMILDIEDIVDAESNYDYGVANKFYSLEKYLQYVVHSVNLEGFMSKTKALESEIGIAMATSEKAFRYYLKDEVVVPDDVKIQVEIIINWIRNIDTDNEFLNNLKVLALGEFIGERDLGYIASLPTSYYMQMKKTEEKEARGISEFVGTEGEKIMVTVILEKIIVTEGFYGTSYIHLYRDGTNDIVWITNKKNGAEGDNIILMGTVKEHKLYKDSKQTILTRCKYK